MIEKGLRNGMVMQRGEDDTCDVRFKSSTPLKAGSIRVEGLNGDARREFDFTLLQDGDSYVLRGIPVGGPYSISINGEYYRDVYVGDL